MLEQLLEAVRAEPTAAGPRLVLADWLQQRGDPLGELIELEHHGVDPDWVRFLYAREAPRILGDLLGLVRPTRFWLGFLHEAEDLGQAPLDSEVWTTVQRLRTGRPELVVRLAGGALRSVHLEAGVLHYLIGHPEPLELERIWPLELDAVPWRPPVPWEGLKRITHLALRPHVDDVLEPSVGLLLPLMPSLEILRIEAPMDPDHARPQEWAAHPSLRRVSWRGGCWQREPGPCRATLPAVSAVGPRGVARPQGLLRVGEEHQGFLVLGPLGEGGSHQGGWIARAPDGQPVLLWRADRRLRAAGDGLLEHTLVSDGASLADPQVWVLPAGAPLGPAPWPVAQVEQVRRLLARIEASLSGEHLTSDALEHLVRLQDDSLALALPPTWPTAEHDALEHQLERHVRAIHPWAGQSSRGPLRSHNEDAFAVDPRGIWAVADGMGGGSSAEPEARSIARALCAPGPARQVFEAAQQALEVTPRRRGNGATATRLVIEGATAHLAWVGDVRAYLIRGEQITLQTQDHTLVREMIERGMIQPWQALDHPYRNIILRYVATEQEPALDERAVALEPGDRILLVTDGVWEVLDPPILLALILSAPTLADAVQLLLAEACRLDASDNLTALLVAFEGAAQGAAAASGFASSGAGV